MIVTIIVTIIPSCTSAMFVSAAPQAVLTLGRSAWPGLGTRLSQGGGASGGPGGKDHRY